MSDDLTPQGSAAVRLAADVVRLKRERDRARGIAVALEQQVARVEALHVAIDEMPFGADNPVCAACGHLLPCPTARAARGVTEWTVRP